MHLRRVESITRSGDDSELSGTQSSSVINKQFGKVIKPSMLTDVPLPSFYRSVKILCTSGMERFLALG
jgi:hypothetical protein